MAHLSLEIRHTARHNPGDRGTQVRTVHRIKKFVEYLALKDAHRAGMVYEKEAHRLGLSIEYTSLQYIW
jgi:hypothetical protein